MSEPGAPARMREAGEGLAILVEEVTVQYRYQPNRPTSLKEYVIRVLKRDLQQEFVHALRGVSLAVQKGQVFGVLGRNGAGKSTLLKAIAGIIRPTKGRVRVWGRVTSLLGVGAGFNPELTGRENIFLYSALLGRSQRETLRLVDEIVAFAELERFVDLPLRTYSTGMVARLGFAVAMAQPPEIMLVDEVLAVGDELFRQKCMSRFEEFRRLGTTFVIVSHSLEEIQHLCDEAVWLHEGRVMALGPADRVVGEYRVFQGATSHVEVPQISAGEVAG